MSSSISFVLDNEIKSIDFKKNDQISPTTTLLTYLRSLPTHKGTKEGCAEGDCGACTVVLAEVRAGGGLSYKAVDSCLIFLPMIHGKQVITVENLKSPEGKLHPVQKALVDANGSQCGFCTPGIVMSLFALYKKDDFVTLDDIKESLVGNLCRCTGYQPLIDAGIQLSNQKNIDFFTDHETQVIKLLKSIKPTNFTYIGDKQLYLRPVSIEIALQLKKKYPQALLLNGATDLALRVTKDFETLPQLIDLSALPGIKGIRQVKKKILIGSGTTLQDIKILTEKSFPALHKMLSTFGSLQIRNLATLGGNLGSASPIGDSAPLLFAYNASVVLRSLTGTRTIRVQDLIRGYRKTDCHPDEIITTIEIPSLEPPNQVHFYKSSKRRDLDIATVSGGFRVKLNTRGTVEDIQVVFGGMAHMTKQANDVEKFLLNQPWSRETIEECLPLIDQAFEPISDARSSAEGRRLAARNLLMKFWYDTRTI